MARRVGKLKGERTTAQRFDDELKKDAGAREERSTISSEKPRANKADQIVEV
jgi:hypothetical protein